MNHTRTLLALLLLVLMEIPSQAAEKPLNIKSYQDVLIEKHQGRLKKNPKDLHALLKLSGIFSQRNQYKKAIQYSKDALSLAPKSITAMRVLAHSFHKTKQYAKAKKLYQKIFKAEPTNTTALFNLGVLALDEKKI